MTAGLVLFVFGPALAGAQPEITQGGLRVVVAPGEKLREFPLQHTDVKAEIVGMVAEVTVTQTFTNPYEDTIEAVYIFPLPHNAAVNDMTMRIGGRTIRGLIKQREEARQIYEQARAAGQTASLLEQERPNIFTQSVANITPGAEILIEIHYVEDLKYDDGTYEFNFPMVVGPRYIPEGVPDASRINPPVLKPGERTGHDISLAVELDSGVPIQELRCRSHQVSIKRRGNHRATITLKAADSIPNKDFMLAWDVAGDKPELAVLSHWEECEGYFTLMIQPKADPGPSEIAPKEMIFVVDCSGSMSGFPIEKAKEAMCLCIEQMNPNDTFRVIRFSEAASQLSQEPMDSSPANIQRGVAYVKQMSGGGGTQMIEGIKAALDYPPDPERVRIVCFMTDGYIGNEAEIFAAIEQKIGDARLFSFGIGTAVNRYLLDGMAKTGRGAVEYVRPNEDPSETVNRFYERISKPCLLDLAIDWGPLEVTDLYPSRLPDLFASQPVILHGRCTAPGAATIIVSGMLAGRPWQRRLPFRLTRDQTQNEAIGYLWARARINELTDSMPRGDNPDTVQEITDTAIEFRLMSAYTAFVAVEETLVNEGGELRTVHQPVPIPESVSYEGIFGGGPDGTFKGDRFSLGGGFGAPRGDPGLAGPAGAAGPAGPAGSPGPPVPLLAQIPVSGWINYHTGGRDIQYLANDVYDLGDRVSAIEGIMGTGSARLAHGVCFEEGLGANPNALPLLVVQAAGTIGVPPGVLYPGALPVQQLAELPEEAKLSAVYLTSAKALALSEEQVAGLKAFVDRGGLLIFDGVGTDFIDSLRALLEQVAPGATTAELSADHDLLAGEGAVYPIAESTMVGIYLEGKLIGVITGADLGASWAAERTEQTEAAFRQGINLMAWILKR